MDLRSQAEQVAGKFPRERLHARAWQAAQASAQRGERWLIALSGGADSVALLLLLWVHFPERRDALVAVHFNHRLRGEESEGDEKFCRELCSDLGVIFRAGSWLDSPIEATEEAARRARYSFFESTAHLENARVLFTGHQKDDIAETQLMRLARGASAAGLAAPRPVRDWLTTRFILRPLLELRRAEIQNTLREAGVAWREDSSNAGVHYFRNRVRAAVVPAWLQAAGNDALEAAALTREWMEEDDVALEAWLDEIGVPQQTEELDLRKLAGKPRGLWRRALRRWKPGQGLSWAAFNHLLTVCMTGDGRCSVGTGIATAANGILRWQAADVNATLGPWSSSWRVETSVLLLPDGAELQSRRVAVDPALLTRLRAKNVDSARETIVELKDDETVVRSWMQGDRYRPLGSPGSAKLQDLFVNRKIPIEQRSRLPVVCGADGRILWVPGFPPADDSKVTDHSVTAVQLTYIPGTSTVRK